jgi:hypothetical protein
MAASIAHPPLPQAVRRRLHTDPVWRRWTAAWVGGSVLGIVNGVIRELVYRDRVGELRANQIAFADREEKDDEAHRHRHRRQ